MARWKISEDCGVFAGLEADFLPVCRFCRTAMEAVAIKLLNFPLNEKAWWEKGELNAYAIDVETWCPSCGFWQPYGVACPKNHWEEIKRRTEEVYNSGKKPEMGSEPKHIPRA